MHENIYYSVWDAIKGTPGAAANMRLRSGLMMALTERIKAQGWTPAEAAARLCVPQPRIADLTRGKIGLFSLDELVGMATDAGLRIELNINSIA